MSHEASPPPPSLFLNDKCFNDVLDVVSITSDFSHPIPHSLIVPRPFSCRRPSRSIEFAAIHVLTTGLDHGLHTRIWLIGLRRSPSFRTTRETTASVISALNSPSHGGSRVFFFFGKLRTHESHSLDVIAMNILLSVKPSLILYNDSWLRETLGQVYMSTDIYIYPGNSRSTSTKSEFRLWTEV